MRFAVAALCVLALTGSASAGGLPKTDCLMAKQPPMKVGEPTVPYEIYRMPRWQLHKFCSRDNRDVTACVFQQEDPRKTWAILIADDLTGGLDEYICVLRYEKSHLAPYFWGDPEIETPETMAVLSQRKKAYEASR